MNNRFACAGCERGHLENTALRARVSELERRIRAARKALPIDPKTDEAFNLLDLRQPLPKRGRTK